MARPASAAAPPPGASKADLGGWSDRLASIRNNMESSIEQMRCELSSELFEDDDDDEVPSDEPKLIASSADAAMATRCDDARRELATMLEDVKTSVAAYRKEVESARASGAGAIAAARSNAASSSSSSNAKANDDDALARVVLANASLKREVERLTARANASETELATRLAALEESVETRVRDAMRRVETAGREGRDRERRPTRGRPSARVRARGDRARGKDDAEDDGRADE